MRKKNFLIIAILLIGATALSGCRKSATNAPTEAPVSEEQDLMSTVLTAQANTTEENDGSKSADSTDEPSNGDMTPMVLPTDTPDVAPVPTNTPAPTTVPTAEPVVAPTTYILHEGEFPYCLARRFDLEITSFVASNPNVNFTDSGAFYAGLQFSIPQGGASYSGDRALISHPASYTTGLGETIYSIACLYGDVYPESISQVNGLPNDDTPIPSGTLLQIP